MKILKIENRIEALERELKELRKQQYEDAKKKAIEAHISSSSIKCKAENINFTEVSEEFIIEILKLISHSHKEIKIVHKDFSILVASGVDIDKLLPLFHETQRTVHKTSKRVRHATLKVPGEPKKIVSNVSCKGCKEMLGVKLNRLARRKQRAHPDGGWGYIALEGRKHKLEKITIGG